MFMYKYVKIYLQKPRKHDNMHHCRPVGVVES